MKLSQYNKKYYKCRYDLLKFSQEEVASFDKKNHTKKDCLLEGRKWVKINGTYYEIPRLLSWTYFKSLKAIYQIAICLLFISIISVSTIVPYIFLNDNYKINVDAQSLSYIEKPEFVKDGNQIKATLKSLDINKLPVISSIKKGNKDLIFDINYTYSTYTQELIINSNSLKRVKGDIVITANALEKQWYNDQTFIAGLKQSDVGLIKEVKVNGVMHKVKLIDIDHDIDENNNKIHSTWEFNNIISDEDGNSLGYQWHDNNDPPTSNYDYINSSIRKALTNQGNFNHTVFCASKNSRDTWSKKYTDKSVISMLDPGLKYAIKKVKKEVRTGPSKDIMSEYNDRLFMLSNHEMNFDYEEKKLTGKTYAFYANYATQNYIKKPVNNIEYKEYPLINTNETIWQGLVYNFAGYNRGVEEDRGGYYWLCTPRSNYSYNSFYCDSYGSILRGGYTYLFAFGVAPCFCL